MHIATLKINTKNKKISKTEENYIIFFIIIENFSIFVICYLSIINNYKETMKKQILIILILQILCLSISSAQTKQLSDMKKNSNLIDIQIVNEPFELEDNGSILIKFHLHFPANYFDKDAKMNITALVVNEKGGESQTGTLSLYGENLTGNIIISKSQKTTATYSQRFFYNEENKNLKIVATVEIKNHETTFTLYENELLVTKPKKNYTENEIINENIVESENENVDEPIVPSNKISTDVLYQKSLDSLTQALELVKMKNDKKGEAIIYAQIAEINLKQANYGLAYINLNQAITTKESIGDTTNITTLYSKIATISQSQNNPDLAISYLQKGIDIKTIEGDNKSIAQLNNQVSQVYYEQENYDEAINSINKIIHIESESDSDNELAASYNNLAIIYAKKDEYTTSELYFQKATEINTRVSNSEASQAIVLNNMANNLFNQDKFDEALKKYEEAYKLKEKIGDTASMAFTLFNIANTYNQLSKPEKALEYYEKSKLFAAKTFLKEIVDKNNYQIAELNSQQEECATSTLYFKKYINSLYSTDDFKNPIPEFAKKYISNDKINKLKLQLDIEKNKALTYKKLLNAEGKINKMLIKSAKNRNKLIVFLSVGLLLFLILALLFLRELMLKKKAHSELRKNYVVTQQQNEEIVSQSEQLRQANEEINTINDGLEEQKKELENTLSNLKKTQSQLIESEKMASLGQLIAGIAHELNTPLGAINSSVHNVQASLKTSLSNLPDLVNKISTEELALMIAMVELSSKHKTHYTSREIRKIKKEIKKDLEKKGYDDSGFIADMLTEMEIFDNYEQFNELFKNKNNKQIIDVAYNLSIQQKNNNNIIIAINKASKIIAALRNYSHNYEMAEMLDTDIIKSIETILTLYHNKTKENIKITKHYQPIKMVKCFSDEINQVWTNIIHNSIQAIEGKGEIIINVCEENEFVKVSFTDSGKGIPDEVKHKIFKPFFTTKATGEGTGLGLDITRKIVEKHKGKITFDSTVGKGTTFNVFIPK